MTCLLGNPALSLWLSVDGHMIWHKKPRAAPWPPAEISTGEEKGRHR